MGRRQWQRDRGDQWTRKEKAWFIVAMVAMLGLTIVLVSRAYASQRLLVPSSIFALILGLLFEYRRIAEKWSTVFWTALGSFAASFLAFLPGKREHHYDIEQHIQLWPYWFCGAFVLVAIAAHKYRIMAPLHESITLLQTTALIYWTVDAGLFADPGPWSIIWIVLLGLASLHSVLHAFLPLNLSRRNRLWLSLWSSAIMLFLAIDNIVRVYGLGYIEQARDWQTIALIVANYFLLGVSSIHMAQNATMLIGFLPGKGTFFNKQYFEDINRLKDDHDSRYSDDQSPLTLSLLCLGYAASFFWLNHHYQWVRSNFAIWAVFFTFPWVLALVRVVAMPRGALGR